MASYVYTATGSAAVSANILTDKVRIATTSSPIHFNTGFPNTTGTGTVTSATNSTTVTGVSTVFTTQLKPGYWIGNASGNTVGIVSSIASNTSLTLKANANVAIANAAFTYSPYGVPFVTVTANSSIIPSNNVENSIIVGQGNVVAYLNVTGATAAPFSITELGAPHANSGATGFPPGY